jgi:predicted DNA-binding transcriptional regulator AlpA
MNAESTRLLKVQEVADHLGVSVQWIYEHSTGKVEPVIPNLKLGKYRRYRLDEIERWLKQIRG